MADNYVQQNRTFRRTRPEDIVHGNVIPRVNIPSSLEDIEKLRNTIYELLATLDETNHRQVAAQIVELNITKSYSHLDSTVVTIIETVLYYPDYTTLYARFCHILSSKTVELYSHDTTGYPLQRYTFHDMLVYRTQEQFASARAEYAVEVHRTKYLADQSPLSAVKERLVTLAKFMADLYTSGVMVNSVMLGNFATIIFTTEQIVLECLCRLLSAFVEKNKSSTAHLKSVECYFEQLRQHYPTKLTAKYYRRYDYMRDALTAISSSKESSVTKVTSSPVLPENMLTEPRSNECKDPIQKLPCKTISKIPDPAPAHTDTIPAVIDFSSTKNKAASSSASSSASSCIAGSSGTSTSKSWDIPLPTSVSRPDQTVTFCKLVEMYDVRQRNHVLLEALNEKSLCKDSGLTSPDFEQLQWVKKQATTDVVDKVNKVHSGVIKLLEDTEKTLQQSMRTYYEAVENTAEEKINELVESLPANSRADVNAKAYETSSSKQV